MPTAQSITLDDGQSTPVSHVFGVRESGASTTVLVAPGETGAAIEDKKVTLSYSPATVKRPTHRVKFTLALPKTTTVQSQSGASPYMTLVGTGRFTGDIIIPDEFTSDDRADLAAFVSNLIADTIVNGYISSLDPMY
jgi:hypothetical protein